jgi:exodeoxyribonuclease VII large subunit
MSDQPQGIPGSALTGPWAVGQYAARLRERLREFARVQVFGEVFGFKAGRAKVWFELRDANGALPCSMWREDFEALGVAALRDGAQVVVAGGCDYYPGSRAASPSFSFAVTELRVAGEGDLLAQLELLRRRLYGEGLFEPQKTLPRPALPRCIGVVTGESGKARDDVVAGLRRRGWGGRVVWAFAPVQDRHAAPALTRALQDLAACPEIDVVIVARGGGSLADLFAFCDETLCRTVALLRVPVIASVGHHTDRTLLDDVAAIACSTPTHAAEAAVPLDCGAARAALTRVGARLAREQRRVAAARVATARAAATMRREGRRADAARVATASAAARLQREARRVPAAREATARSAGRLGREGRRVPLARGSLVAAAARLDRLGRRTLLERARTLAQLSRAPAHHVARHRTRLHQLLRELRAVARRSVAEGGRGSAARAAALSRKAAAAQARAARAAVPAPALERAAAAAVERRRRELERLLATLDAHDPQRTLERGYALVEDAAGEPVTTAAAARAQSSLAIRLHDGRVEVRT